VLWEMKDSSATREIPDTGAEADAKMPDSVLRKN
jgi:hypothetical protein